MSKLPPMVPEVAAAFAEFPEPVRRRLLDVRSLIFATAAQTDGVGPLTETLKWGEPAYLTEATASGSTVRLGWSRSSETNCAVLFNCRTTLVETFRAQFGDAFGFEKNRAILLATTGTLPLAALSACLAAALTYHRRRQR
jgi:uncharacterized protein DUF1801